MLNEDLNDVNNNNKKLDYEYEDFGEDDDWGDYKEEGDYNDGEWDEIDDAEDNTEVEFIDWEDF
ncbi:MAG: hypothetical protein KGD66_05560 [Candidatus Lokiarchaeota archaeon]|nr:hypothetical protein [Candidatus Lokiarchaeota archaeon]